MTRTRCQYGGIERKVRQTGPDVWVLRYREYLPEGGTRHRSTIVGTVDRLRSKKAAHKAALSFVTTINKRPPIEGITFGALVRRFERDAMPERYSTRCSYLTMLNRHIVPKWGDSMLAEIDPVEVETWLKAMAAAPTYKGKMKALMHRLFELAMKWKCFEAQRNPMDFVELRGITKRTRRPLPFTIEQYAAMLPVLPQPYRTMVTVAQCVGLRANEVLALQWSDVNFDRLTLMVTRGVVHGRVDDTKTEYSHDELPVAVELASILLDWRAQCPATTEGWIFPNPATLRPYHASPIQQDYIRKAGRQLGFGEHIGWHTFRHAYRALLDELGTPVGVQQKLMRHASVQTTMNVYGTALLETKRLANSKAVERVLAVVNAKEKTA